jgi:hypothetical protein
MSIPSFDASKITVLVLVKSLTDWTVESQWVFVLKHHMFLVFKFKPLNLGYIGDLGASQSPGLDCACPSCHLDRAGGWVLLIQNWGLIHIWRFPKIGVPPNHPFIDVFFLHHKWNHKIQGV